ncbi:MAG: TlyA family RNA methyltransferase [Deltaproteobacteria bacterium]
MASAQSLSGESPCISEGDDISPKERIDLLLVRRGLVPTRAKAQALLMAGVVSVNGLRVDKAGSPVAEDAHIEIKQSPLKYVSRGGLKLEAAISAFKIEVSGKIALDVGASTGGFTDCLLQFGAAKVYAVDVGRGQLDWNLRRDSRVSVLEKINARHLTPEQIGESVDIAVMDVSFISLTKIIPAVAQILKARAEMVALIKPQFEVGRGEVGRGGIVRDEAKHRAVIDKIVRFAEESGFVITGVIPSPILGADGNREFLIAAALHRNEPD